MKFIPKQVLTETMAANPLDNQISNDQDVTKLAQEGILTAIAAETDAINQYTQIADLVFQSEPWFKEKATPVINDIVAEEKKHLGQLTEFISNLPGYKEDIEAGEKETETGKHVEKESVTESVIEKAPQNYTLFDLEIIAKILEKEGVSSEELDKIYDDYRFTVYPSEVDDILARFNFNEETLNRLENEIIEQADFEKNEITKAEEERIDAAQSDIDTLECLLDPEDTYFIRTAEVRDQIRDILFDLKNSINKEENI